MRRGRGRGWARVVALLLAVVTAPAGAQDPAGPRTFRPEELEQIVAPVALYPDSLLAQALMASTYPLEVVEATRFVKANPKLAGDQLGATLKQKTWDDSVKSLVAFPQVLEMMNDKLDWMQRLGDAFLAQQKDVMDAVQRMRAKAQAEGNLTSNAEQTVRVEPAAPAPSALPQQQGATTGPPPPAPSPTVITIAPTNPQVVYVPTYNPTVVYGAWPYPAYPPYYYYPPGYAVATAATAAISFGVGMAVGASLWGGCNWGRGDIDIDMDVHNSFSRNVNVERSGQLSQRTNVQGGKQSWQHNPDHRRGVQYRDTATQQRFNRTGPPDASSREAFRGRAEQGRQDLARGGAEQFRGRAGAGGDGRPGDRAAASVPSGSGQSRQLGDQAHRGDARGGQQVAHGSGAGAFEGLGQGHNVQAQRDRGHASLGSARAGGHARPAGGGGGHRGGGRGGRR